MSNSMGLPQWGQLSEWDGGAVSGALKSSQSSTPRMLATFSNDSIDIFCRPLTTLLTYWGVVFSRDASSRPEIPFSLIISFNRVIILMAFDPSAKVVKIVAINKIDVL